MNAMKTFLVAGGDTPAARAARSFTRSLAGSAVRVLEADADAHALMELVENARCPVLVTPRAALAAPVYPVLI